jgi:hypothetical protein
MLCFILWGDDGVSIIVSGQHILFVSNGERKMSEIYECVEWHGVPEILMFICKLSKLCSMNILILTGSVIGRFV